MRWDMGIFKTVGRLHAAFMTFCCMEIWWEFTTFITSPTKWTASLRNSLSVFWKKSYTLNLGKTSQTHSTGGLRCRSKMLIIFKTYKNLIHHHKRIKTFVHDISRKDESRHENWDVTIFSIWLSWASYLETRFTKTKEKLNVGSSSGFLGVCGFEFLAATQKGVKLNASFKWGYDNYVIIRISISRFLSCTLFHRSCKLIYLISIEIWLIGKLEKTKETVKRKNKF